MAAQQEINGRNPLSNLDELLAVVRSHKKEAPPQPLVESWDAQVQAVAAHIRNTKPKDITNENRWVRMHEWTATLPNENPHVQIQAAFDLFNDPDSDVVNAGLTMLGSPEVVQTIVTNTTHYQRALHGYGIRIPLARDWDDEGKPFSLRNHLEELETGSPEEFAVIQAVENVLLLNEVMGKDHPAMPIQPFIARRITADHALFLELVGTRAEMAGTMIQQRYAPYNAIKESYAKFFKKDDTIV